MLTALFIGVLTVYATEQKVEKITVGFTDTLPGAKPEQTSIMGIGYSNKLGFPYSNRELGVELPSVMTIDKLVVELELTGKPSDMAKFGIDNNIKLYVSKDNKVFTRVEPCKLTLEAFKHDGKNAVRIIFTDFSAPGKYFKLCPRKGIKGYSGIAIKLQLAVTVYKNQQMLELNNPRLLAGRLQAALKLNIANYLKTPAITVSLRIKDKTQLLATEKLSSNGSMLLKIDQPFPDNLPVGKYRLEISLIDNNKNAVDSLSSSFYHVRKIVETTPGAGETEFIDPSKTGTLTGKWTAATVKDGLENPVLCLTSDDLQSAYSLNLPESGTFAVYVGLIGPGAAKIQVPGKTGTETVRLKTWRKQLLSENTAGEAFIGLCKGGIMKVVPAGKDLKLSYVRLQGLTEEQLDLANSKTEIVPRLIIHQDGFSGFYAGKMKTQDEILAEAAQYENKPLYSFDWCLGTSTAFNIKTRRGVLFGEGKTEFWRQGDKQAAETVNNLYNQGINPLKLIAEKLNQAKIHVNATLRLNATYPPQNAASHNGPFLMDNPQYRVVNVHGKLLWQLSYAHPEVRDFMLSVLEDAVACGVDGIHLQFLRHPPFFGLDKPLIAEYEKSYGSFNQKQDYMNDKWQKLQCEMMTDFVGRIHKMLDAEGLKRGKKLTLSASFDFKNYYAQGLDVEQWVKSGWLNVISPGYYGAGGKTFDLAPFVAMCRDTDCKIFPNLETTLLGHDPTPDSETGKIKILRESVSVDYGRKLFLEFYNQGAYGLYPFNGGYSLIGVVADMKALKLWETFEQPVINWFSKVKQ